MGYLIAITIIITSIILSLRYHALSQNNNYKLPLSSKLLFYYFTQFVFFILALLSTIFLPQMVTLTIVLISMIYNIGYYFASRTKYKFTKRGLSLFATNNTIYILFALLFVVFNGNYNIIYVLTLSIFYPITMSFSSYFTNSYYNKKNKLYVANATEKLLNKNIIKIGITGSYGKTSCKNILKEMLMTKYKVYATKSNYNTPMGISIGINELTDEEVFIAEMGARSVGDISELTKLVKPDYGIITGVTCQHLKTFKSLHNIFVEKFSLAKALSDKGVCIFNGNDKYALKMYKEHIGEKKKICLNKNGDICVENVDMDSTGSKFSLQINDKLYFCHTKLLGRHNIINIALCTALALELGVDIEDIVKVIKNLQPTPHRLEYSYSNGIHILDDSYNSNLVGIKSALECLAFFHQRKVVLAQGIVELGKLQKKLNEEVGKMLAKTADVVLLTGSNKKYIKNGLNEGEFSGELYVFRNLRAAQQSFKHILHSEDILLLQNDLPDVF